MKVRILMQENRAITQVDLLTAIAVLIVLASMFGWWLINVRDHDRRQDCIDNLKQINISLRIWEGGNIAYPMIVSVTNGGAMELVATGNVAACFQVMSKELSTPKILVCPSDQERIPATNFQNDFNNSHISYFINPDADESYPQEIMDGDDNLATTGVAVKSGMLVLSPGASVSWTIARHAGCGNIGYADGSVAEISRSGLQSSLILATNGTLTMTNRFVIP